MYTLVTHAPVETHRLGVWLGERLQFGDFVALTGDLGAGKTLLCQGILKGLGVERSHGSPTFTLLWEYQGRLPVCHWDVYRLHAPQEMEELGYEEYFLGQQVNLVEWADQIRALWPPVYVWIDLRRGEHEADRRITFSGSARYLPLLEELKNADFSA